MKNTIVIATAISVIMYQLLYAALAYLTLANLMSYSVRW